MSVLAGSTPRAYDSGTRSSAESEPAGGFRADKFSTGLSFRNPFSSSTASTTGTAAAASKSTRVQASSKANLVMEDSRQRLSRPGSAYTLRSGASNSGASPQPRGQASFTTFNGQLTNNDRIAQGISGYLHLIAPSLADPLRLRRDAGHSSTSSIASTDHLETVKSYWLKEVPLRNFALWPRNGYRTHSSSSSSSSSLSHKPRKPQTESLLKYTSKPPSHHSSHSQPLLLYYKHVRSRQLTLQRMPDGHVQLAPGPVLANMSVSPRPGDLHVPRAVWTGLQELIVDVDGLHISQGPRNGFHHASAGLLTAGQGLEDAMLGSRQDQVAMVRDEAAFHALPETEGMRIRHKQLFSSSYPALEHVDEDFDDFSEYSRTRSSYSSRPRTLLKLPAPVLHLALARSQCHSHPLLACSTPSSIYVVDPATGQIVAEYEETYGVVAFDAQTGEFSQPSGHIGAADFGTMAAGTSGGLIKLWSQDTKDGESQWSGHSGSVTGIKLNQNSLLTSAVDGNLKQWDLNRPFAQSKPSIFADAGPGHATQTLMRMDEGRFVSSFDTMASVVAAGTSNGPIQVRDTRTSLISKAVTTLSGHSGRVNALHFPSKQSSGPYTYPDDVRQLVTGGSDGSLRTWDLRMGMETDVVRYPGSVAHVMSTDSGSRLLLSLESSPYLYSHIPGTAPSESVLTTAAGQPVGHDQGLSAFCADRQSIWTGGVDGSVSVWNGI